MRRMLVVVMLGGCLGPLAPGETRCSTSTTFGVTSTRCKTGAPQPVDVNVHTDQRPVANDEAPRPRVVSDERREIHGGALFCSRLNGNPQIGTCMFTMDACDGARSTLPDNGPCESTPAGACFIYTAILDGKTQTVCTPSISGCDSAIGAMSKMADYKVMNTRCDIYRAE